MAASDREKGVPDYAATNQDDEVLMREGKKPVYHRQFTLISLLGLCVTTMISWEAAFFTNTTALVEAGPVGVTWGYFVAWIGSFTAAVSLAELASIAPVSAGQFYWVAMLAPERYRKPLTWFTGWMNVVGWQFAVLSATQFIAVALQTAVQISYPDTYQPQQWHVSLIIWAMALIGLLFNTVGARILHTMETGALVLHFLGWIGILAALATYAPRADAAFVFSNLTISSGWDNAGVAFLIGVVQSNFAFLGYDGPCHVAEETRHAQTTVPNAMVGGTFLSGLMGWAIVIAFIYNIDNLADAVAVSGFDFPLVFLGSTGSVASAVAMTAMIMIIGFATVIGCLTAASRMIWAFARDRGMPFSTFFAKLQQPAAYPLNALVFSVTVTMLLSLINIGSTTALAAFISVSVTGIQVANLVPICLLIAKKIRGNAPKGPWSTGRWGLPINITAVAFLIVTIVFSFFPTLLPVKPSNMNWSCVVFGAALIGGWIYYIVLGRHVFQGPVVEILAEQQTNSHSKPER